MSNLLPAGFVRGGNKRGKATSKPLPTTAICEIPYSAIPINRLQHSVIIIYPERPICLTYDFSNKQTRPTFFVNLHNKKIRSMAPDVTLFK